MNDCTCQYCYHEVCFHPQRGDEANLGVLCDGCTLDDIPQIITDTEATFAITLLQ